MRKYVVLSVCMLCLALVCPCAWGDVPIDEAHFPDEAFREYLSTECDNDGNGTLNDEELASSMAIYVDVSSREISSLKGIEYLTKMVRLWCYKNNLTELDLTQNTELAELLCYSNKLAKLDISNCTKLIELDCNANPLTELDLSKCRLLKKIQCSLTDITALNLSGSSELLEIDCELNFSMRTLNASNCTALKRLWCHSNALVNLDVSGCTALSWLNCGMNNLSELDVTGCTMLQKLNCSFNNLRTIDVSRNVYLKEFERHSNALSSLDISSNPRLVYLDCYRTNLQTLNLSNNPELAYLECGSNSLSALELNNNPELVYLECPYNSITTLDTLSCPKLAVLICDVYVKANINPDVTNRDVDIDSTNFPDPVFREYVSRFDRNEDGKLSSTEVSNVTDINCNNMGISSLKGIENFVILDSLHCKGNNIEELDLSHCPLLYYLDCESNKLIKLDLSSNAMLWIVYCQQNSIGSLELSDHTLLESIHCYDNKLTELDVSNCLLLDFLACENNELAELIIANCPALEILLCENNKLTTLDFSDSLRLEKLYCWENNIARLDVSNTALHDIGCLRNPLTELIARNCRNLKELWCYDTGMVTLDISNCTALEDLSVYKNNLANLNVSGNTALKTLNCWDNKLSALDVRNCTNLLGLFCSGNQLTDIDTSANTQLTELSCARNNIRTLNLSHNTALTSLYCYDNQLRNINLSSNTKLESLACSDNQIIDLDLSANTALVSLDCSANYLNELDLTPNKELEIFTCRYTTLRSLNVKGLAKLAELNVERGSLTMLNLTGNPALKSTSLSGSRYEGLYLTHTENTDYPYQTDMRLYVGDNLAKASNVLAFDRTGGAVSAKFDLSEGVVRFAAMPVRMTYDYDTGLADSPAMSVTVSIPTRSFIYLPKVQPSVYGVDESVHEPNVSKQTDSTTGKTTVTVTYAAHYVGHASLYDVHNESDDVYEYVYDYADEEPDEPETPIVPIVPESPDNPASHDVTVSPDVPAAPSSGSGGGGCDSGFEILSACVLAFLPLRKRRAVFALVILGLTAGTMAGAEVRQSDYTLPIQLEDYMPAGTWTTDFALTPEIVNTVAAIRGISADKVRNYSDIAAGTWEVEPSDLYNLARNGEYGGVTLPLTRSGTSDDFYVILCTFSNDVKPGELLSVQGFEVSADTRQSVYSREHSYAAASWVTLDDTFTRIEAVPENRRVYLAVSFRPEYVNTGILTVIRGAYVEEDNPLARLDPDIAQRIADDLGISLDKLQYVSRAYLGDPREPTPAMLDYVKSNDREIVLNLPTVSIDAGYEGVYFNYRLPDDVWEEVKGKDFSEYTIYALNDSEISASGQRVRSSSILGGFVSLWELNGGKMDSFTVQDFLIAGLLQASRPFSFYLAKMLIMLLLGGCSTGINPLFVNAVILALIVLKFPRKH